MMGNDALKKRGEFNVEAILRIACTPETLLKGAN
jgi:hypothetical protein